MSKTLASLEFWQDFSPKNNFLVISSFSYQNKKNNKREGAAVAQEVEWG